MISKDGNDLTECINFSLTLVSMCVSFPLWYLDMLSGEQAELFPVDTLVSMLSELSRLSVS